MILKFVSWIVMLLATIYVLWSYNTIPYALFRVDTDQCVELVYHDGISAPCNELPKKYHKVWVSQEYPGLP